MRGIRSAAHAPILRARHGKLHGWSGTAIRKGNAMAQRQPVTAETAGAILDAFNAHDLDAIMGFFAEDCSLEMPPGRDPWGRRFVGKAAARRGGSWRWIVRWTCPAGGTHGGSVSWARRP